MTTAIDLLFLAVGLALGAAIVFFAQRAHVARLEERLTATRDQSHVVEALIERTKNELRDATATRASERVGELVAPIAQKLIEFDSLVRDLETKRSADAGGLKEQIASLLSRAEKLEIATSQLSTHTSTLVSALRDPKTRGRWGEMQLHNVVDVAGMLDYCDFDEQLTVVVDESRVRPDMTVRLPNNGRIYVDAKVPLDRFLDAVETNDETVRRALLKDHAKSLRDHASALAKRNYGGAEGAADLVVMFVPGESFLSAACHENPKLIEDAVNLGILIASPLTLIALLRSYAVGWQAVRQEENAKHIATLAQEFYESVCTFAEHLQNIGGSLGKSLDAYNKAVGSLERNVLSKGRRLKELGRFTEDLPEAKTLVAEVRQITALDAEPRDKRTSRKAATPTLFQNEDVS
jgi:DNA recombination protein RmuC